MKIFVSSVRRGLETERDSLPGYIRAIGHTPVVFEDFTAQPFPSRQVCLEAVGNSDVCILLIGPEYGDVLPDTGVSPTEEEFTAAKAKGIPILAFHKLNVAFRPEQAEFAARIEKYAQGVFRGEFVDANDLRRKLNEAIIGLAKSRPTLIWTPLSEMASPVPVLTRSTSEYRPSLALSFVPVPLAPLSIMQLRGAAQRCERILRESGAVAQNVGLESVLTPDDSVIIHSSQLPTRYGNAVHGYTPGNIGGISASASGQITAWHLLSRDFIGVLISQESLRHDLAVLLRLTGQINAIPSDRVSLSVAVNPVDGVREGDPKSLGQRSSGSMSLQQGRTLETRADDCVSVSVLVSAADEIADELARRVLEILPRFH